MDKATFKLMAMLSLAGALFLTTQSGQASTERHTTQISGEIGVIGGSVSRSTFTEAVVNREPKNRVTELPNNKQYIYYFSELKGMTGQVVTHRWLSNGKLITEVKFRIGSPRWRVWSGSTLQSDQLGIWEVQVINEMGQVVHSDSFNYIQSNSISTK